jgi:hypothetical protein
MPPQATLDEGWNGLATSTQAHCGVDEALVRYRNALWAWLTGAVPDMDVEGALSSVNIDGTAHSAACIACLAADRAVHVFAPVALDAIRRHQLAARLRRFPRVTTPSQARNAADAMVPVLAAYDASLPDGYPATDDLRAIYVALNSLSDALEEASSGMSYGFSPDNRPECLVFEGLSDTESKPMDVLVHAVEAGVPVAVARREALKLLADLARAARARR